MLVTIIFLFIYLVFKCLPYSGSLGQSWDLVVKGLVFGNTVGKGEMLVIIIFS